jgi:hypothetical protein
MLSGATFSASEMAGTAVFRIVVSSDSIKNATATSHGKSRLLEADGASDAEAEFVGSTGVLPIARDNYSTNESQYLLATVGQTFSLSSSLSPSPSPRHFIRLANNHLYKTPSLALFLPAFLATIKRL